MLAGHIENSARRHQAAQARQPFEEVQHHTRAVVDQLLEIVQNQQHVLFGEEGAQLRQRILLRSLHAQRAPDGIRDQIGIAAFA